MFPGAVFRSRGEELVCNNLYLFPGIKATWGSGGYKAFIYRKHIEKGGGFQKFKSLV
jgi:hypothetical protein